jgi:sugar O-acyltransferase (sialic acid O-acetyltransferase NeuD family)
MKNILLFGASGHCRVIIDILEKNKFNIIGVLDDKVSIKDNICGYAVLGKISELKDIQQKYNIDVGIISIGDNITRYKVYQKIISIDKNFKFISAIHPQSNISKDVKIKDGSVIMAGVNIGSGSFVDRFCIINTNASLEHTSILGEFSSLAPFVATGGDIKIGGFSAICISVTISHGITIGDNCVVGASSLVLSDIGNNTLSYGIPAKKIKDINEEYKYL